MHEYACQVFHCSLTKYLWDEIERIQKRATYIIYPDLSYADAIVKADLPSPVNRRDSLCSKLFDSIGNNNFHNLMNLQHRGPTPIIVGWERKGTFSCQTLRPIVPEILSFSYADRYYN